MIADPLCFDLEGQTAKLLAKLPSDSVYVSTLTQAATLSQLITTLSRLLAVPALTTSIADLFRPILFDLCARWLEGPEQTIDQLVALCLLLEIHEQLFPILHYFLLKPSFKNGPLSSLPSETVHIQRLLLAYYRILQANRCLPGLLQWSLMPLNSLITSQTTDKAVRLLAIRCYALQTGMAESVREELEEEMIGEESCFLDFGHNIDGSAVAMDAWVMPVFEMRRIQAAREAIAAEPVDYYKSEQTLKESDLSPLVANVFGVFLLRASPALRITSTLVSTPTAIQALQNLALYVSLRFPVLLTSPPSSGKSLFLAHLAETLFPQTSNHIIQIQLADTSMDARSLLGYYVSSQKRPGMFEWKDGILVRAMREGRWVVFKDIDRASAEVLGVLKPLIESLGPGKWIGERAALEVPGRGRVIAAHDFVIFATRSVMLSQSDTFSSPVFYGAHKFHEVTIPSPSLTELKTIIDFRFHRLAGSLSNAIIRLWNDIKSSRPNATTRDVGMRELEKFCTRIERLLPASFQLMDISDEGISLDFLLPNPTLREEIFLNARDVFLGANPLTSTGKAHAESLTLIIARHLGIDSDRTEWLLKGWTPDVEIEKDVNGHPTALRIARTKLMSRPSHGIAPPVTRPFALHRPAVLTLSRITSAVALSEPVLLTGETGTGKTSVVSYLASLLQRSLITLNLSHQTESADLLGGFKPIDTRVPASALLDQFLELFAATFSRKKNQKFEVEVRKAVAEGKWKRAVGLWRESARMAKERIESKKTEQEEELDSTTARKRRKVDASGLKVSESSWGTFEHNVNEFETQYVTAKNKFAFDFVEGPIVKALRSGDWVLLDEINLATPETLECIASLLHSPTGSITLTEQGLLQPIPRHPDFRLFACMNPATDVGKKDLPPTIRSRFTEIDVPPPDADRETLLSIITQYIGASTVGDKAIILQIAEFYLAVKELSESRKIADGSNRKPHFSMRTLARALTFAADTASTYGLRRSVLEGSLMAFTMGLDANSAEVVVALAHQHLLAGTKNPRSLLSKDPVAPKPIENYIKVGPFYLEKGSLPPDPVDEYILTPSVEKKLVDLSRIILTRRFPVLIEGPTSSGKTSAVEYLARRTGHHFVRINNHEHTDIQEYLGSYIPDPTSGKLVFADGLLVRALRYGHWIVLDELNLAPTDVLEALNRLLDDNRELVIPETQEVLRPHPHFMLFATQNPPGLYAGRKVLSRAFRNRFLEVHFDDVPQSELETILCQRCLIAPSYGKKIVGVFLELQKRRQAGRVFESKHGFATLRDLFRWAGRDAVGYQELADNGYMLLAERARREDDKTVVKEVIESVMGVKIDERALYGFENHIDLAKYLECPIPSSSLIWTSAMQRLFILISRALRFNEPVLLVGETGCGKTSVCQVYAEATAKCLHTLNCHQNTETADLIGGLRPIRNRGTLEAEVRREADTVFARRGLAVNELDIDSIWSHLDSILHDTTMDEQTLGICQALRTKVIRLQSVFEWHDGPLVKAMKDGELFLLDEISLADDSVLERLNSVLESARTITLAEKGGDKTSNPAIQAAPQFKLVATMNPGGDYGKKELSPALRNRFTEIWVPPVNAREDLEMIVDAMWKHDALRSHTALILDFIQWLCGRIGDHSLLNIRDILTWVMFSNSAYKSQSRTLSEIFHHGAHLAFIDGLASLPQLAAYSSESMRALKAEATMKLQELSPFTPEPSSMVHASLDFVQIESFTLPKGPLEPCPQTFNFAAPTTRDNTMRVVRACQVSRPILLEGSPGVGKTSLVTALAKLCGHELHRVNLSDQTDLMDLFGSDLPAEGGGPGEFAWKDAEFLKALQEGHWVLLDEMNLAPQAVLEGLNAVLDHRGTVYIPELDRYFTRHPSFRVFAAQNPVTQGGGRKGLPKSFLNRFTKVYVEELSADDFFYVCRHVFPALEEEMLRDMIALNSALNVSVSIKHSFAHEGSPWEFNLRDIFRWATLLCSSPSRHHPSQYVPDIYLHRFRTARDRDEACLLYQEVFRSQLAVRNPSATVSALHVQVGNFVHQRGTFVSKNRPPRLLKMQLSALESIGHCISQSWLAIVTGPRNSGKTQLVRTLASLTGNCLHEISINSTTDTMDILGSFEQADARTHVLSILREILIVFKSQARSVLAFKDPQFDLLTSVRNTLYSEASLSLSTLIEVTNDAIAKGWHLDEPKLTALQSQLKEIATALDSVGRFEWIEGPLIRAMRDGHWLLLDGANLCNPSVLDRLNSLCEPDGVITLNERGHVNGQVQVIKPHPDFRLFMSVDPQFGELSRAMRNRGIEIALISQPIANDSEILQDFYRLPRNLDRHPLSFELIRRGLSSARVQDTRSLLTTGRAIDQHSALSYLVDESPAFIASAMCTETFLYFIGRTFTPAYTRSLEQFLSSLSMAGVTPIRPFLQSFLSVVQGNITMMREEYATKRGLPAPLISVQPLDFFLKLSSPGEAAIHRELLSLLDVAMVFVLYEQDKIYNTGDPDPDSHDARAAVELVLNSAREITVSIIRSRALHGLSSTNLSEAFDILKYARHLLRFSRESVFDYSAVQAVARWISDRVQIPTSAFSPLIDSVKNLLDSVTSKSGLGLVELWTSFLTYTSWRTFPEIERLELLLSSLEEDPRGKELRRNALNIIALKTLKPFQMTSNLETLHLQRMIEQCLSAQTASEGTIAAIDPCLLLIELGLLVKVTQTCMDVAAKGSMESIEELIKLSYQIPHGPLSRLAFFQHLVWSLDAKTGLLPALGNLHSQWLKDLCAIGIDDETPILFRPLQLDSVISLCYNAQQPLSSVLEYESQIHMRTRLSVLESHQRVPRIEQVEHILQLSILKIVTTFVPNTDIHLVANKMLDCASLKQLLHGASAALSDTAEAYLIPALFHLATARNSRSQHFDALGLCFVAVFKTIAQLLIPDHPIDPSVAHTCSADFWRAEQANLSNQIQLHSELEVVSSGSVHNAVTEYLNEQLEKANKKLEDIPSFPPRLDSSRLRMYWSEIRQFRSQITSTTKLDTLLRLLTQRDQSGALQESVLQNTILTFSHRLKTGYGEYDDISAPFQFALLHLRLGLHLTKHAAHESDHDWQFVSALTAFPTVASSSRLRSVRTAPASITTSPFHHVVLVAWLMAADVALGAEKSAEDLEETCEQAIHLWLVDKAKADEIEQQSQSLYRHKNTTHDIIADSELEKVEFLKLFPSYEEDLNDVPSSSANTAKPSQLVDSKEIHQFVHAIQAIICPDNDSDAVSTYHDLRLSILTSIIQSQASLPEILDTHSLPLRLRILQSRSTELNGASRSEKSYNFYIDANVPEAKRASSVMQSLQRRLVVLIQEWPEQMVLVHLKDRCDAVLALDILSPVAKLLSAVEQVLIQTDDWEIYANRDNNLKDHRAALTRLIVEWRRLELSCWQGLLESQARDFENEANAWWFQLYNAIIRGPLSASDPESIASYVHALVPLLDEFIRGSPLGQFQSRMKLIQSFQAFCALLRPTSHLQQTTLACIERVLHFTFRHYNLFSETLSLHLLTQRTSLQNEVVALIKLASWKDVNVLSLKQSSQRTHHQLYKIIRKFRDILREPIHPRLSCQLAGPHESIVSEFDYYRLLFDGSTPEFPPAPLGSSGHLQNLAGTYAKFNELISRRILPFIQSCTPDTVEAFAVEIIVTTQNLANLSVSSTLPAEKQEKQQKALTMQKRKAWSDLLKELKRAGLSPNVKPRILQQHSDSLWVRDQPIMPFLSEWSPSLQKLENYFSRLQGLLPDLRSSIPSHHADLTTRELQRSMMFLESGMSFAVESRATLAGFLVHFIKLSRLLRRLHVVASSSEIVAFGSQVLIRITALKDLFSRVHHALDEVDAGIKMYDELHPTPSHGRLLQELKGVSHTTKHYHEQLVGVIENISASSPALLVTDESVLINGAVAHADRLEEHLASWSEEFEHLRYLLEPTSQWLASQSVPSLNPLPAPTLQNSSDAVVEACLIGVQTLLAQCPEIVDSSAERSEVDNYVRDQHATVQKLTNCLDLTRVSTHIELSLLQLACRKTGHQAALQRFLPFCDRYLELIHAQLTRHIQWVKTLFKLVFVLCSVIHTLTRQGFCKPPPSDETGEEGDAGGNAEGLGVGEGSGMENASKSIEDESQVEGLRGEEPSPHERGKNAEDDDAIEMSGDFEGEIEDVPDDGSQAEEGSENEEDAEPDEHLGDLNGADDAVDEKLWGDEQGGDDMAPKQTNQDRSENNGKDDSELVAKEGKHDKKESKEQSENADGVDEQEDIQPGDEEDDLPTHEAGAMDNHVPDADTLELPDDMNLDDVGENSKEAEESEMNVDEVSAPEEDIQPPATDDREEQHHDTQDQPLGDEDDGEDMKTQNPYQADEAVGSEVGDDNTSDHGMAQADIKAGDETTGADDNSRESGGESQKDGLGISNKSTAQSTSQEDQTVPDHSDALEAQQGAQQEAQQEPAPPINEPESAPGPGVGKAHQGEELSAESVQPSSNPLRSLGDALKEIRQRLDRILESNSSQSLKSDVVEPKRVEYLQPDDEDFDMQALGPAFDEKTARLDELNILDSTQETEEISMNVDLEPPIRTDHDKPSQNAALPAELTSERRLDIEDAIMHDASLDYISKTASHIDPVPEEVDDQAVEAELRDWQTTGLVDNGAEHMWNLYESLTHDLAYALCEQLRLIMEPTLATRLKGDYRSGKRLNMKKIIAYIASDYTKDKIWLRRTKPSQREYQILIALDDSRSMAESHSVHLAYQTLALVSKALSRLEAGDIAIARFGESVDVLHGFEEGQFTDQAGVKVMQAFKFDQKATNVLSLLNTSLQVLEKAREQKSMSSASSLDLWQLQIIISDGICQDHDRLRAVLRKAEEQRVMIVFIIVDSLHSSASASASDQPSATQGSILSMEKAEYKTVDGRLELQLHRYLDSFPFEYYVVLRNVEALPDVLSATLKQFFERISEY